MRAKNQTWTGAGGVGASTPFAFLLQLMQMRLPVDVVDARELKLVSLLKATELIDAELYTSAGHKAANWNIQIATILRITENGLAELADSSRDLLRATRSAVGMPIAPLEYLSLIETCPFPLRVEGGNAMKSITVLKAAGFIDATISPISHDYPDVPRQALIIRITSLGRDELARRK